MMFLRAMMDKLFKSLNKGLSNCWYGFRVIIPGTEAPENLKNTVSNLTINITKRKKTLFKGGIITYGFRAKNKVKK